MRAKIINNIILLDFDEVEVEKININGLVNNTVNTWQANRSIAEKRADTEIGKFAEVAVISALKIYGTNCYYSYDSFRTDNYKLHAPFDGLLIKELKTDLVSLINKSIISEGTKLSSDTREKIRQSGGFTVEVKSTRLAQKYKDRVGFHNYENNEELKSLLNELNSLDFLTYPYFTRYGDMTFDQYCWFAETHYLHTYKRGQELRDYVTQIELSNAADFYIRVFVDEIEKKVLIMGCLDRYSFFAKPKTQKLVLPGKSEIPLYFVKSIKDGHPLEYMINVLNHGG